MGSSTHLVEVELAGLRTAWTDAIRDRDEAALDRLMADDFVFIDERGRWGKAQFIENTRRWVLVSMAFADVLVRDYGAVVAMHARVALHARLDGREMSGEWHLTDIWARRGERCQVVARQWSRASVPEPTASAS